MSTNQSKKKILVIGGAGYVGAILIPKILQQGYETRVLDLYLYGEEVFSQEKSNPNFVSIKGDLRDPQVLDQAIDGVDTIIHLACISNDPSFDLDPSLGKSINYDALGPILRIANTKGVRRFIFASSAATYGVQSAEFFMKEDSPPNPQTDYAKYKLLAEEMIRKDAGSLEYVIIRSATVCGYSPRMRLDVLVNMFTAQAFANRIITVFTGENVRPHIHIQDITDLYLRLIDEPRERVHGQTFNAGGENMSILALAKLVKTSVGDNVEIKDISSPDIRSCRLDSTKIFEGIGFKANRTVGEAIEEVRSALQDGRLVNPIENPLYYNIKMMKLVKLA